MSAEQVKMQEALNGRIRERARGAGVVMDKYDPDFFLGVIMEWLRENDAALTASGVRRFKR